MDGSPPGSSIHGILQARILERVAIFFFRRSSPLRDRSRVSCIAGRFLPTELWGKPNWRWKWKLLSRVQLFVAPWTIQSMEFSRLEYWSGEPFPRGSSQPRDQTQVSRTAGGFFYQLSHQGSQLKKTEGQLSQQMQACLSSSGFTIGIKAIVFYIRVHFLSIQSVISLLFGILIYSAFFVPQAKFAKLIFI